MSLPNTLAIMNQIQSLISSSLPVYSSTVFPATTYKTVALEAIEDWTDKGPVCEIAFVSDNSEHYTHSGGIMDTQGFRISTAVSFTQQTPLQAITSLTAIRDQVIPLFQQHAYLGGLAGVGDSRVKPGSPKLSFVTVGGQLYLVHEFVVEVESTYTVPIGANGI